MFKVSKKWHENKVQGRCFGVFVVDFEQVFRNWIAASINRQYRLENLQCHEHL